MKTTAPLILTLFLSFFLAAVEAAPEKGSLAETDQSADWSFTPDLALPNVLILGDSISIRYTLQVRELLKGKAIVFRPMTGQRRVNYNGTIVGVANLDERLAGKKWSMIHFNWGLHDLKHVKTPGSNDKSNDPKDPTQPTLGRIYSEHEGDRRKTESDRCPPDFRENDSCHFRNA
jgi:acyl-CoA thioesterase-1